MKFTDMPHKRVDREAFLVGEYRKVLHRDVRQEEGDGCSLRH